jgi:hypothetical protein
MKMNLKTLALGVAVVGVASAAFAATVNMSASVRFRAPLVLTKVQDIDFGFVSANLADTYTISTAGVVSAAGQGEVLGGTPRAGNVNIKGSNSQAINISLGNYTTHNGVRLQNASCAYNGGSAVSGCAINAAAAPASAGKTLLVGVQAVVDGSQNEGVVATPSFDITVVYN